MLLTVRDLEKLQTDYPNYQMELVKGEIIIMRVFHVGWALPLIT